MYKSSIHKPDPSEMTSTEKKTLKGKAWCVDIDHRRAFPNVKLQTSPLQHPYRPVFVMPQYEGVWRPEWTCCQSAWQLQKHIISGLQQCVGSSLRSVFRLAGRAQILPPQRPLSDHLQPVENIMWPVGCATLWKSVSISILGSLYVSFCALRLALHSATRTHLQLKAT